jgi:integrase
MTTARRGHKRGNGEGSIYQRKDGRWAAAVVVGRKTNGAIDRRTVYGHSRAEVVKQLDELRLRRSNGLVVEPNTLTVATFLTQWLRDTVTMENRDGTLRRYTSLTRNHILPTIGHLKLSAVQPAHLQRLYAGMTATGKAPSTTKGAHAILHKAFEQAVEWRYLARNPAQAVKPPALKQHDMHPLAPEEANHLIASAESLDDRWAPLWRMLLDSGARLGEALALTWNDVDLERGSIIITKTLQRVARDGVPVIGDPKTARSRRMIPLSPATTRALRAHRARQAEVRLAAGAAYAGYDLAFASRHGFPFRHQRVGEALAASLSAAGLPRIRVHDLRHSAATLMLGAGVPAKVASERLGHSSVAFTLDRYSHVTTGMQDAAVVRLTAAMGWD